MNHIYKLAIICLALLISLSSFALLKLHPDEIKQIQISGINGLSYQLKENTSINCTYLSDYNDKKVLFRSNMINQDGNYNFTIIHYTQDESTPNLRCTYQSESNGTPISCHIRCCNQGNSFNLSQCQSCGDKPRVICNDYKGKPVRN